MGINNDSTKVTMDFKWSASEESPEVFCKYHHTDEFGPTISISDDGEEFTAFSVQLFVEIVDYLKAEGVLSGHLPQSSKQATTIQTPIGVVEYTSGGLPMPSVEVPVPQTSLPNTTPPAGLKPPITVTGQPMESFGSDQDAVVSPVIHASMAEEAEFAANRQKALKKAAVDSKAKIKSSHKEGEVEEAPKREPIISMDMDDGSVE